MRIVDFPELSAPVVVVGFLEVSEFVSDIFASRDHALVADAAGGLLIVDVEAPVLVGASLESAYDRRIGALSIRGDIA